MNIKKTWFITGCDSGMGHAVAKEVLSRGDAVILTARDVAHVQPLVAAYPDRTFAYQLDVTDHERITDVVAQAEKASGGIDVLLNNAGYGVLGPAEETLPHDYRPMFEVNFFGLVEVTRAVLPYMRTRGAGHIFNTSSLGGYAASAGFAFYAASKFAVEGFSDALKQEVASLGIEVMVLEPGSFRTLFAGASLRLTTHNIAAYAGTSIDTTRRRIEERNGNQPNDPVRLAQVLFRLARSRRLPLRLPLGADAVIRVRSRIAETITELDHWEPLAHTVAFDHPAGSPLNIPLGVKA
jgi:NAD(P)-dependent dehydrogenase (short-subunit alcohol dehydrogenase family)